MTIHLPLQDGVSFVSNDALGWVYAYSPFEGTVHQCHCACADSANDQYDYELWFSVEKLARKARCSEASARRALQRLCAERYLLELETRRGNTTRYRLLFPDVPLHFDPRAPKGIPVDDDEEGYQDATPFSKRGVSPRDPRGVTARPPGSRGATPGVSPRDPNPRRTAREPKKKPKPAEPEISTALFDASATGPASPPPWRERDMTWDEWARGGKEAAG